MAAPRLDQQPQDNTTHLLVNDDLNGLKDGLFIVRVNNWTINLFIAVLTFRHYKPEVDLPFTEQSAMEHVLSAQQFRDQARYVPQHWFNAYENFGRRRSSKGKALMNYRKSKYGEKTIWCTFQETPTRRTY
ncbi:hypothetical protein EJ02DRAFT_452703 [Clathrospora elynae]|uniref:Uncharacterized protein n=1 Tax=Clathrospora elynae TaxID=706981 RepID=A0A6A5T4V0_9PLEO|nr:hypothetical protein EJ02DRAFT_452703 [Clathrospora elynae]